MYLYYIQDLVATITQAALTHAFKSAGSNSTMMAEEVATVSTILCYKAAPFTRRALAQWIHCMNASKIILREE
jgi:hypothetical protein